MFLGMRSMPRWLLLGVAPLLLAGSSRPQEGSALSQDEVSKMMQELERYKAENAELKQSNTDLEEKSFHMYKMSHGLPIHEHKAPLQAGSSFMQTNLPPQTGGFPQYSGVLPVAEYGAPPGLNVGMPSAFFGPPTAAAMQEQSLLQSRMSGFNSISMGAGSGLKRNRAASRHENFDSFLTHMETRQRNEDIEKALGTLRGALGDGSGNGELPSHMSQALQSADQVQEGVGAWQGVSKETMEAAPAMANAVQEAAASLEGEHNSLKEIIVKDHNKVEPFRALLDA